MGHFNCHFCPGKFVTNSGFMKHMRSKHNSSDKFVACFNGNKIVLDPENCKDTFSLNENEPTTKQINKLPVLNETNENDLGELDREAEDYLKDAIGIFSIDSEENSRTVILNGNNRITQCTYICEVCNKEFMKKSNLKRHVETHNKNSENI